MHPEQCSVVLLLHGTDPAPVVSPRRSVVWVLLGEAIQVLLLAEELLLFPCSVVP